MTLNSRDSIYWAIVFQDLGSDSMGNEQTKFKLTKSEKEVLLGAFPQGIVAIDIESTGLSPLADKIVELAAVKVTPQVTEVFESLVNPQIPIPEEVTQIHQITTELVQKSPPIEEVLPTWLQFVGELPIIAHNAGFDLGFIIFNLGLCRLPLPDNKVFCSLRISRAAFTDLESHRLDYLCEYLKIPLLNHHRARDDAIACLQLTARALKENPNAAENNCLFSIGKFKNNTRMHIPQRLEGIVDSLQKGKSLEIIYNGGSHKGIFRPITPVALLPTPKHNVLYAHCLLSDLYKSFILDKIQEFRPLAES